MGKTVGGQHVLNSFCLFLNFTFKFGQIKKMGKIAAGQHDLYSFVVFYLSFYKLNLGKIQKMDCRWVTELSFILGQTKINQCLLLHWKRGASFLSFFSSVEPKDKIIMFPITLN